MIILILVKKWVYKFRNLVELCKLNFIDECKNFIYLKAIIIRNRREDKVLIALVQKVRSGSVEVEGEIVGNIGKGFVVLVGVCKNDEPSDAIKLAEKVINLRVFEDDSGKMNLSMNDVGGEILAVSQFTLCANTTKGNRPSFADAMNPEDAQKIFTAFVELLKARGIHTETGVFGAKMMVKIHNDGPVTIWLDSKAKRK